jgi:transposase-like protein
MVGCPTRPLAFCLRVDAAQRGCRARRVLTSAERVADLTEHLLPAAAKATAASKTVLTEDGEVEIAVPRDRAGGFEPQLIAKGQTRFDDKNGVTPSP